MAGSEETASREVAFLEKLQRLLAEGDFTSTYKFAVLIGLTELSALYPSPAPEQSHAFTTVQLAEQVARLYWPQVRPFSPDRIRATRLLRQNQGAQATIVSSIHGFQQRGILRGRTPPVHLDGLRHAHPDAYASLLRVVEWKLIEMPLPRLQEIHGETDEFIYGIGWTKADVEPRGGRLERIVRAYQKGERTSFDNRILMKPGVADTLRRLRGITRDLVEARWVLKLQQIDPELKKDHSLRDHLFGLERRDLTPVRPGLVAMQRGRCFYCGSQPRTHHVDHFLPHALSRVNFIENLVASCGPCNTAKTAHLPSERHADHWIERVRPGGLSLASLRDLADLAVWPRATLPSLNLARLLYGQHPAEAGLWQAGGALVPWSKPGLLERIGAALREGDTE